VICSEVDKSQLPIVKNNCIHPPNCILKHRLTPSIACRSICKIESDFSSQPLTLFKLKNRHWWNSGPKYHRISFIVKVNLGPADISFELWLNGTKLSKDNSIKVEWQASPPPAPNATSVMPDFPMSSLHLPVANGNDQGSGRFGKTSRMSSQQCVNGYGWEAKNGVHTSVLSMHQNGSAIWGGKP
jgi:hypothetical protein